MLPQEIPVILGVLRCILVLSEAYREAHRASSLLAELLEHWKPSPLARAYSIGPLSM